MGVNRDLKKATEAYWGGKLSQAELLSEAKRLRLAHWKIQKDAGVDVIPSNDFALYDQVLHQIQDFGVSFSKTPSQISYKANLLCTGRTPQIYPTRSRSYRRILCYGPWSPEEWR